MKKLGFGTMRLPLVNSEDTKSIDVEEFKRMVDHFIENGFTYFDTAYPYHDGESEKALKLALVDRYPRNSFTVTSKLPPWNIKSFEDRDKLFSEQLSKIGVQYFDYYLLHCIMENNYESVFEKFDCFNWIIDKKKQGLIKEIGFSFHDNAKLLDEILTKHPYFDFVQLQINYLDWDTFDIQSKDCLEVAKKHGKKLIVMEPVKGGALAVLSDQVTKLFKDKDEKASMSSWAIRFAASCDNVFMVLSGMSNLSQLVDNVGFMKDFVPLSDEEFSLCLKAAELINSEKAIKCTACSYCTKGCPKNIQIPEYFKMYNRLKQATSAGTIGRCKIKYMEFLKNHSSPLECIECGQCEDACPQHLSIREYLKDVSKELSE